MKGKETEVGRINWCYFVCYEDEYCFMTSLKEKELNRYVHSAHRIPLEQNSYVDALTPNVTIFGDRAFKEIIKIK